MYINFKLVIKVWQDGYAFHELNKKLQQINNEKEEIGRHSQSLRKRKPTPTGQVLKQPKQQAASAAVNACTVAGGVPPATAVLVVGGPSQASLNNSNSQDGFLFAKPDLPKE